MRAATLQARASLGLPMFDEAFAAIAAGFSDMAGGPFADAQAEWMTAAIYDDGGSITTPGYADLYPCKAQIDAPTQQMRAAEGFLETDARILVLASSIGKALDTNATVIACGHRWALLTCQRDAVDIGFECRARKVV